MAHTVVAPDGRHWTVRVHRFRLPPWRECNLVDDGDWDGASPLSGVVVVLAWLLGLAISILVQIAEAPLWLVRTAWSGDRDVTAATTWPSEIEVRIRTTREHAPAVARFVAERLSAGYADIDPPHATFVSMTRPHWLDDT